MPTQNYAVERNGPKRIEVTWKGIWNEFAVKLDGQQVGTWSKDELKEGKEVPMPDGSKFKAHLRRIGMGQELALLRNGQPLPGSGADPVQLAKTAAGIVYFLAGANALLGVLGAAGVQLLANLGVGIPEIVLGAILGVLGFFSMQRSRVALGIAMALYAADGVLGIVVAAGSNRVPAAGIVIHILFLTAMWRGFKAMGELKANAPPA
jgi:hypothetical protein